MPVCSHSYRRMPIHLNWFMIHSFCQLPRSSSVIGYHPTDWNAVIIFFLLSSNSAILMHLHLTSSKWKVPRFGATTFLLLARPSPSSISLAQTNLPRRGSMVWQWRMWWATRQTIEASPVCFWTAGWWIGSREPKALAHLHSHGEKSSLTG